MSNELKYVVLQRGKKEPVANPNGKGWLLTTNIDAYEDLGIYLKNQDGVICIDFDNLKDNNGYEKKIIEAIQKEYPSKLVVKTDRGMHLYYKTNRKISSFTKSFLNLGIKADGKIGNQYTIIKRNNQIRPHYGEIDLNCLTELPDILLPLKAKDTKIQAGIDEGSRNDSLFQHLCKIRKFYDDVDLSSIAHFINKYLYTTPMDKKEVDTIIESAYKREIEVIKDTNNESDSFYENFLKTIEEVRNEYKVHLANNNLYFYDDGHYINNDFKLQKIIYEKIPFSIKLSEDALFQMKMIAYNWKEDNILAVKNGIIKDGIFIEDKEIFTPYYIDVIYDPKAYNKTLDNFLQFITCNEESEDKNDLRIVIEEMLGHCLMFKDFPHKVFLLVGNGLNGKSTFVNMLYSFLNGMYVNIPLNYLTKSNYLARIVNKLAVISDDIDYDYLQSSQNIKKISSGDYLSARELYGKSFDFRSTATQIYTMNELVKFKDKSFGMERRLCIIPFKNEVKEVNPRILEELTSDSAKSYLLNLALSGIDRIKKNHYQLSESKIISKSISRYLTENDTVEMFLVYGELGDLNYRRFSSVYSLYKKFCVDNEYIPLTKNGFSRRLKAKGYVSVPRKIDDVSVRVIIKECNDE